LEGGITSPRQGACSAQKRENIFAGGSFAAGGAKHPLRRPNGRFGPPRNVARERERDHHHHHHDHINLARVGRELAARTPSVEQLWAVDLARPVAVAVAVSVACRSHRNSSSSSGGSSSSSSSSSSSNAATTTAAAATAAVTAATAAAASGVCAASWLQAERVPNTLEARDRRVDTHPQLASDC